MDRDIAQPKVKRFAGPNTRRWLSFHHRYAAKSTYLGDFVWDRKAPAIGPFCTDVDGNVFLDFVSHVGASPLGYNHPELVALQQQLSSTDPDRYAGADFVSGWGDDPSSSLPTPAHLHHKIVQWTKPFGFDTAFFSNTGAEAIENAIKICYDHRKNNGYGICFDGAFHGRSLGALSLNRSRTVQRKWYPMIPKTMSFPYATQNSDAQSQMFVIARNGKKMSRLSAALDPAVGILDPQEIAYVIIEPMQGEGGYNIPQKDFMQEVQEVCAKHDIPLIVDEIQSGLGRSGKRWACEHFGMRPDMLASSKGLRVGATIGRKEMFPKEDGRISGTWCEGNAAASALGYKTLEIIDRKDLVKNADVMGKYLRKQLESLSSKKFSNARGLGLMDAIDVPDRDTRNALMRQCLKEGLLLIGCGNRSLRFLPPLDVTKREIDLCIDILESASKKI